MRPPDGIIPIVVAVNASSLSEPPIGQQGATIVP